MKQNFILCPICGKHKFPSWEDNGTCICPHCGWGHDSFSEENISEAGGPNDLSLENYKLRYEYYVSVNPKYYWSVDKYPEIPQIEKTICPVCKKYEFVPLSWDDIYCGVLPSDIYCMSCGWHYDINQLENHTLKDGINKLSVNEYRDLYKSKIEENSNYNFFEEMTETYQPTPHKCPVCGKYKFKDIDCYEICPYCGWEDDGSHEDNSIGANEISYNEYKKNYCDLIKEDPNYRWKKSK